MDWSGLRSWLAGDLKEVTGELAYRVALRTIPLIAFDLQKTWASKVGNEPRLLSFLRALITIRVANDRPDMDLSQYLQNARIRIGAVDTFDYAGRAIRSACNLQTLHTRLERYEELRKTIQAAKDGSQNVAQLGRADAGPYSLNTWSEVERDTELISSGASLPNFAVRDPATVQRAWSTLRDHLLFYNEGWRCWIEWLEFRLFGFSEGLTPAQWQTLELKLATAGDSLWSDTEQITAFFQAEIDNLRSTSNPPDPEVEAQNPAAILFAADEQGRIDLDRSPLSTGLPAPSDPMLLEALSTANGIVSDNTENSAVLLRERAEKYRDALLNLHQASGPGVLIVRGESLRLLKRAYESASEAYDLPPLTEEARIRLDELVAQHNVLVGLNPALASVDRLLQPTAEDELLARADLDALIHEARKHEVLTEDADSALSEVARQADPLVVRSATHQRRASESGKNLVRIALRVLLEYKRAIGIAVIAVPPALYAIGRWALANERILTSYFHTNPGMQEAIRRVFEWLHTLPLL